MFSFEKLEVMRRIIFFMAMIMLSACARNEGIPTIPPDMEATNLAEILKNPAEYDGKRVLLEGSVAYFCVTSGCHFTFQQAGATVDVYPKGFKLPKLKKGQSVKVYAEVKAGEKRITILALGLEVE